MLIGSRPPLFVRQGFPFLLSLLFLAGACRPRGFHGNGALEAVGSHGERTEACDVVIVGGSTAATAAALAAAREIRLQRLHGRRICLLEPTDWPGGQLTASGVAAIDFDHHSKDDFHERVNLTTLAENNSKVFAVWMGQLGRPVEGVFRMDENEARCMAIRCYLPRRMVDMVKANFQEFERDGTLKVFYNTVPKRVEREGRNLRSLVAVQRLPRNAEELGGTYNRRLSATMGDWYDPLSSQSYEKTLLRFAGRGNYPVFVDATEWGEVMVLARAQWRQGVEGNETCGQAMVFPLAVEIRPSAVDLPAWYTEHFLPAISAESKAMYSHKGGGGTFSQNWRYRRMKTAKPGAVWDTPPAVGDISQINVNDGNDYSLEYLFAARREAEASLDDWKGGIRLDVLARAEVHSLGYFQFLRENDDGTGWGAKLALSTAFGTGNGLSKVPYMRDTRRSVGVGGFSLSYEDLMSGTRPSDTVAIGLYAADQHPVKGCRLPVPPSPHPRPFHLPLRAHTNASLDNFLVAGKLMAQDFLASAATRLHPIEFASGTAVGVAAVFMNQWELSSASLLRQNETEGVVARIEAHHGPTRWTR